MVGKIENMLQLATDSTSESNPEQIKDILSHIGNLREDMETKAESYAHRIDDLKNSSSNPGSSYHWLVFVLLYAGIYFLQ